MTSVLGFRLVSIPELQAFAASLQRDGVHPTGDHTDGSQHQTGRTQRQGSERHGPANGASGLALQVVG